MTKHVAFLKLQAAQGLIWEVEKNLPGGRRRNAGFAARVAITDFQNSLGDKSHSNAVTDIKNLSEG